MKSFYLIGLLFFASIAFAEVDSCQKFTGEFYCPDLLSDPANLNVQIRKINSDEAFYEFHYGNLVESHHISPETQYRNNAVYNTKCDSKGITTTIDSVFAGHDVHDLRIRFIDSSDRLVFHNETNFSGELEVTNSYCTRLK